MHPLTLNVTAAALPLTLGVPLNKSANVFTVDRLTVKGPNGQPLAAAFRVLARWNGKVEDSSKPLKWVLVDFTPKVMGRHTLDDSAQATPLPAFLVGEAADTIRVKNAALDVRLPKSGQDLIAQFLLNGVEQFSTGKRPRLEVSYEPASTVARLGESGWQWGGPGAPAGQNKILVNDGGAFQVGQQIKFELKAKYSYHVPDAIRLKDGNLGDFRAEQTTPTRQFVFARGTRREFVLQNFAYTYAGDHIYRSLPDNFPSNLREGDTVEDQFALAEPAHTITAISGNELTLDGDLQYEQLQRARVYPVGVSARKAYLTISRTTVEEYNPLRCIVKQEGRFVDEGCAVFPHLTIVIRYYFYAEQPFVRVRVRFVNATNKQQEKVNDALFSELKFVAGLSHGTPQRTSEDFSEQPTRSLFERVLQRAIFGLLKRDNEQPAETMVLPLPVRQTATTPSNDAIYVHSGPSSACARIIANQSMSTATARQLKLAVAEFAENFPARLTVNNTELAYHIFPKIKGQTHTFFADWAKTWDFYLGEDADRGLPLTNSSGATFDPEYICNTQAIRHALVAKREWQAADFNGDATLAEAANRAEALLACAYDLEACAPKDLLRGAARMTLAEYRLSNHTHAGTLNDFGEHFGWQRFGNTRSPADGFTFNRYDLHFSLLREWVRTGDARAFRLGSEHTRYMADAGTVQSSSALNNVVAYDLQGLSRYERSPNLVHGVQSPRPTHSWSEGLWLYWALTGDPIARETALLHAAAARRWNYRGAGWQPGTVDYALVFNEARGPGWAALELLTAYRYDGDENDLQLCRQYLDNLRLSEEAQGGQGVYVAPGYESTQSTGTQPFVWAGYPAIALTEYIREMEFQKKPDFALQDFLIRQAVWLLEGDDPGTDNCPLVGGERQSASYEPLACVYNWYPGQQQSAASTRDVALADLLAVTLTVAARLSDRADLRLLADSLFKDVCFYRDAKPGPRATTERFPINFRSVQFLHTAEKVWAQTAQALATYLPDAYANQQLIPPQLLAVAPAEVFERTAARLILTGANFQPGAVVYWNAALIPPDSVTSTQIVITVPAAQIADEDAALVVRNPNGGQSQAFLVRVLAALLSMRVA